MKRPFCNFVDEAKLAIQGVLLKPLEVGNIVNPYHSR